MAIKIYLSPAAHETDHPCAAVKGCSENTHANEYLDEKPEELETLEVVN